MKALALSLAITALLASPLHAKDEAKNPVIAKVNKTEITAADINLYMRSQPNAKRASNPNEIVAEMVSRELLRQEAKAQGLEKSDSFKKELEVQKTNLLVNALLEKELESADLSDDALKKEYDKQVSGAERKEFKARHILVKEEAEAKTIITELQGGANFQKLAKEKSTGPSGPNGGDLGWFQASTMVPEFGKALKAMKKEDFSLEPVKTKFGWHVILLEDMREREAPKFEDAKEQLKALVANRKVQEYIKGLRDKATIDFPQPEK